MDFLSHEILSPDIKNIKYEDLEKVVKSARKIIAKNMICHLCFKALFCKKSKSVSTKYAPIKFGSKKVETVLKKCGSQPSLDKNERSGKKINCKSPRVAKNIPE